MKEDSNSNFDTASSFVSKWNEICEVEAPSADLAADLYEATLEETKAHGLENYEISNYALPGHECRHNLNYWRLGDYIGIGPGAASRLTMLKGTIGSPQLPSMSSNDSLLPRYTAHNSYRIAGLGVKHPEKWKKAVQEKKSGVDLWERLSPQDSFLELLLTGLRTKEGVAVSRMAEVLGIEGLAAQSEVKGEPPRFSSLIDGLITFESYLDLNRLEEFLQRDMLRSEKGRLKTSEKGAMKLDGLLSALVR